MTSRLDPVMETAALLPCSSTLSCQTLITNRLALLLITVLIPKHQIPLFPPVLVTHLSHGPLSITQVIRAGVVVEVIRMNLNGHPRPRWQPRGTLFGPSGLAPPMELLWNGIVMSVDGSL